MSTDDNNWTIEKYKNTFTNRAKYQPAIFDRLSDCQWHCRDCAGRGINSQQYAGGGGIQGLQRGTKSRPGLEIISEVAVCSECNQTKACDKWTGSYKTSNPESGIPPKLQASVMEHYGYIDTIELRQRSSHELVIDHRFPMERWGEAENTNSPTMTAEEIEAKFQLLKKDTSGNHNLLKSRACERCIATNKRQYPLGIKFFYSGTEDWPNDCPKTGADAERGCIGCGWYDFAKWRESLNDVLTHLDSTE
ncbi:restriction endonuclease [Ruminococcus sp. Marseille-P6503]|uniref:restriction endonuclease n=1 Tax=Ruminococcus sp. Marseille-P6503 TaxID=2364796 RepID=UPI000F523232|nr:restriction endonuclease [Ruminococcus sp. Marseille-P6503]